MNHYYATEGQAWQLIADACLVGYEPYFNTQLQQWGIRKVTQS